VKPHVGLEILITVRLAKFTIALVLFADVCRLIYLQYTETADKCIECTFRVLVSLTHAETAWAENLAGNSAAVMFLIRTIVRSDSARNVNANGKTKKKTKGTTNINVKREASPLFSDEDIEEEKPYSGLLLSKEQALDRLCLALGLLTNLVQGVDDVKRILRETSMWILSFMSSSIFNAIYRI
jgi:hypothetical protein